MRARTPTDARRARPRHHLQLPSHSLVISELSASVCRPTQPSRPSSPTFRIPRHPTPTPPGWAFAATKHPLTRAGSLCLCCYSNLAACAPSSSSLWACGKEAVCPRACASVGWGWKRGVGGVEGLFLSPSSLSHSRSTRCWIPARRCKPWRITWVLSAFLWPHL